MFFFGCLFCFGFILRGVWEGYKIGDGLGIKWGKDI